MQFSSWLEALATWWTVPAACLVSALCTGLALQRLRELARLVPPQPLVLLDELRSFVGGDPATTEVFQRAAVAELNQRLSDVAFELGLLPARLTALTRICLASGTALALLCYIGSSQRLPLERVLGSSACAVSGLVGSAILLGVGRTARVRSREIRENWDRTSRETGKSLGASLDRQPRRPGLPE